MFKETYLYYTSFKLILGIPGNPQVDINQDWLGFRFFVRLGETMLGRRENL